MTNTSKLGDILLQAGVFTSTQLQHVYNEQQRWGGRIAPLLIEMGVLDETQLVQILHQELHLPVAGLEAFRRISREALRRLPAELCEKFDLIPIGFDGLHNRIQIAILDPTEQAAIVELKKTTSHELDLYIAPLSAIRQAIRLHLHGEQQPPMSSFSSLPSPNFGSTAGYSRPPTGANPLPSRPPSGANPLPRSSYGYSSRPPTGPHPHSPPRRPPSGPQLTNTAGDIPPYHAQNPSRLTNTGPFSSSNIPSYGSNLPFNKQEAPLTATPRLAEDDWSSLAPPFEQFSDMNVEIDDVSPEKQEVQREIERLKNVFEKIDIKLLQLERENEKLRTELRHFEEKWQDELAKMHLQLKNRFHEQSSLIRALLDLLVKRGYMDKDEILQVYSSIKNS